MAATVALTLDRGTILRVELVHGLLSRIRRHWGRRDHLVEVEAIVGFEFVLIAEVVVAPVFLQHVRYDVRLGLKSPAAMFAIVGETVLEHLVEDVVLLGDGRVLAVPTIEGVLVGAAAGGGASATAASSSPAAVLHLDRCEIHLERREKPLRSRERGAEIFLPGPMYKCRSEKRVEERRSLGKDSGRLFD